MGFSPDRPRSSVVHSASSLRGLRRAPAGGIMSVRDFGCQEKSHFSMSRIGLSTIYGIFPAPRKIYPHNPDLPLTNDPLEDIIYGVVRNETANRRRRNGDDSRGTGCAGSPRGVRAGA